jgi:hypothetical protein
VKMAPLLAIFFARTGNIACPIVAFHKCNKTISFTANTKFFIHTFA